MHAVFLDEATFGIKLTSPKHLTTWTSYRTTAQDDALIVERCLCADIIITNKVIISRHVICRLPD